jgi:hypothetical protein
LKTQLAGKSLASAVVICELWRLAVALQLLVVPSRVYKWLIDPFTNPNPIYSLYIYVTALKVTDWYEVRLITM